MAKKATDPEIVAETAEKTKKKKLTADQWLKLGGLILALVGTIITILKFIGPNELSNKQREYYIEVTDVIGELIAQNDNINDKTAYEFDKLYNGRMMLVEDSIVSRAMRRFRFELVDRKNGVQNVLNPNKFQKTGIEVIELLRNTLEE